MSLVSINDVLKITTKVEKIHPYKVVGDRDSYSPYNEGWSDCVSLIESYLEKIPYAEPEQKTGRKFLGIVVNYPKVCTYPEYEGKPYYSIKYEENGEMIVGFGTYKPEVLSQYLREYFLPSAEPDNQVHLCGFCKYGYPECPAEMSDVIFGNGIGHDNVCVCAKFEIKPERKKGKWVKDEHTYSGPTTYNYVCSACGAIGGSWLRDLPKNLMYPFCPHCGADMMRGEDGKA